MFFSSQPSIILLVLIYFTQYTSQQPTNCAQLKSCPSCANGTDLLGGRCTWCLSTTKCQSFLEPCQLYQTISEDYNCPDFLRSFMAYNPKYVRTIGMPFLCAANKRSNDDITNYLASFFHHPNLTESGSFRCMANLRESCFFNIVLLPTERQIVLTFRTNKTAVTAFQSDFVLHHLTPLETVCLPGRGQVLPNIFNAFNELWEGRLVKMRLKILLLMYPEYEVKIFGHSIASGIADLFAVSLVDTNIVPSHKIALYSFGAPRTGNIKFARTFDNLVPNSFRIINGYDPIVRLPPRNPIRFYHHRTEVWYNNGMGPEAAYETSTIAENRLLSSDEIKSHLNDHYNYFGFDIFDC